MIAVLVLPQLTRNPCLQLPLVMVLLEQLLSMRLTLLMLLALAFQLVVVGTVAALSLAVQYT